MKRFGIIAITLLGASGSAVEAQPGDKPRPGGERPHPYRLQVNCAAFSPDGNRVAVGLGHAMFSPSKPPGWDVQVFDVATGKHLRTFGKHNGDIVFVQFFPDGKKVLSIGMDYIVRIWDVEKGEQISSFPKILTRQAALLPDGKRLLLISRTSSLQMWDVIKGELVKDYQDEIGRPVSSLVVSPNGKLALVGHVPGSASAKDATMMRMWNVENGKMVRNFDEPWASPIAFSRDSELVFYVRWNPSDKKMELVFCSVSSGSEVKLLPTKATGFGFYDADRITVAASHRLMSWRLKTGEELFSINPMTANQFDIFVFAPDGRIGLSGGGTGLDVTYLKLVLWDLQNGKRLPNLQPRIHGTPRLVLPVVDP